MEYLAGNLPIYPNEYYAKVGPEGFGRQPVGTGPYRVAEVDPGKKIVFVKNDNYFKDSPKGQPSIGKLVQRTIPVAEKKILTNQLVQKHVNLNLAHQVKVCNLS